MHDLLSGVEGLEVRDFKDSEVCCGFGGSFSLKNHQISAAMAHDKLQNAIDSGAQYLVSNESSCLMHMQTYAKKQKMPITPVHIADFIALILNL